MRAPASTYRIQLGSGLGFLDAARLVAYLDELGVTELYASPVSAARAGSSHGYDVVDPTRLDARLGTDAEFDALAGALRARRMGLVLDVVPNHMAASTENPWWRDVLEHGPASAHADAFDIEWLPPGSPLQERVLLPILGRRYGRALERGELRVAIGPDGLLVRYYDHRVPLDPGSYAYALSAPAGHSAWPRASDGGGTAVGADAEPLTGPTARPEMTLSMPAALADLLERFAALPPPVADRQDRGWRRALANPLKAELWERYRTEPVVRAAVDARLERLNGRPGDASSYDRLDRLLARQPYLLAYWKTATEEINYRRFFNISDLVCLRVERLDVFDDVHALPFRLVESGAVTGLRIDHVDGLYDPLDYLRRLGGRLDAGGAGPGERPYVVVEKILSGDEELPEEWPVAGTTGYDFLDRLNGLFVDPGGLVRLGEAYAAFTGESARFAEIVHRKKRQVMDLHFGGEIAALARALRRIAAADRHGRDLATRQLGRALAEVTACLPVYRTYSREGCVRPRDEALLDAAIDEARRRRPWLGGAAFELLRRVLLLRLPDDATETTRREWVRLVMRWQQFSGPVMAKGLEDSALYAYNRLLSMNDVGGEPDRGPVGVPAFHRWIEGRRERWPATMNTTSTHDTKRSEDVRARLNVLSELAAEWGRRLHRWHRWNRGFRSRVNGRAVPTPNEEVHLYQTLLGAWPIRPEEVDAFRGRLDEYLLKAAREAKVHTSWLRPDAAHEEALAAFTRRVLEPRDDNRFLHDLLRFQRRLAFHGAVNSLAQVLLKAAAPGVPDFYQGCETWNFSLVDPDNRRPVDFGTLATRLARVREHETSAGASRRRLIRALLANWIDGDVKLFVTWKALTFRRSNRDLFAAGDYVPVPAAGARADHVCAFARRHGGAWALVAAPRLCTGLTRPGRFPTGRRVWRDSALRLPADAPAAWTDVFTGTARTAESVGSERVLRLGTVFASFPLAMLYAA